MVKKPDTAGDHLAAKQMEAFERQAHNRTVRLIDRTDEGQGGSAVPITISRRFFLATAAHVIPPGHQFEIVASPGEKTITRFIADHRDERADVGLLEIDPADATSLSDERLCSEDMILTGLDAASQHNVVVAGYPAEYMAKERQETRDVGGRLAQEMLWTCNAYLYDGFTVPPSEWPTDETRSPAVGRDIFVKYHPENRARPFSPRSAGAAPRVVHRPPPDPKGLSGGGIWLMRESESKGVWRATMFLIAVQTSSYPQRQLLRGTLLAHWLALLRREYPDLQQAVSSIEERRA